MAEEPLIVYILYTGTVGYKSIFLFDIITRHRPLCDIVFSYSDGIILLYTEYTVDAVHMYIIIRVSSLNFVLSAFHQSPESSSWRLSVHNMCIIYYIIIYRTQYDQEVFSHLAHKVYQKVFELAER